MQVDESGEPRVRRASQECCGLRGYSPQGAMTHGRLREQRDRNILASKICTEHRVGTCGALALLLCRSCRLAAQHGAPCTRVCRRRPNTAKPSAIIPELVLCPHALLCPHACRIHVSNYRSTATPAFHPSCQHPRLIGYSHVSMPIAIHTPDYRSTTTPASSTRRCPPRSACWGGRRCPRTSMPGGSRGSTVLTSCCQTVIVSQGPPDIAYGLGYMSSYFGAVLYQVRGPLCGTATMCADWCPTQALCTTVTPTRSRTTLAVHRPCTARPPPQVQRQVP